MNNFSKNSNRIAKILFISCLTFLFAQMAQAQDKIHKKSGKILNVKIVEIGVEDIRYQQQDQPDGIVYTVEKVDVEKVVLENGLVQKFGDEAIDLKEVYAEQRKNALKFSFLGPLSGYSSFTYEHAIKPGCSLEMRLGIIGLGVNLFKDDYDPVSYSGNYFGSVNKYSQQLGFFLALGYKFILKPSYQSARQRHVHILNGAYFRPEVAFGNYTESKYNGRYFRYDRIPTTFTCFILSGGKQWVINDRFMIDCGVGLGYGVANSSPASYGYIIGELNDNSFAYSTTLAIGFLFDKPKAKTTPK